MFEAVVLVLHFSLNKSEQLFEMVFAFVDFWIVTLDLFLTFKQVLLHLDQSVGLVHTHWVEEVVAMDLAAGANLSTGFWVYAFFDANIFIHLLSIRLIITLHFQLLCTLTVETNNNASAITHPRSLKCIDLRRIHLIHFTMTVAG